MKSASCRSRAGKLLRVLEEGEVQRGRVARAQKMT